MSDVFISYARSTAAQANAAAEALRAAGYSVWLDEDLPTHRAYTDVIEEQLAGAKAALVIWSAEAVRSEWVRSEANRAREDRKLVQVSVDGFRLPMPFDQIQCADLAGWAGAADHAGWKKALSSIAELANAGAAQAPTTASITAAPLPLPDKPSIAVLAFADPSGAVEGDYFADGMVEEIVTALSRFRSLFVVGSASGLSYRAAARNLGQIAKELGVRYLLEGSVRRSGKRVRISVSLTDALENVPVWNDRFEGTLEDVFALQDEVANAVAPQIEPHVQAADLRRGSARPTEDLGAYDLVLRGRQQYLQFDKPSSERALSLFEQAYARDPSYATALAWAAVMRANLMTLGWTDQREKFAAAARDEVRRALISGPDDPDVLAGSAYASALVGGDIGSAAALVDRALSLNPGSSTGWVAGGWIALVEQREVALERFRRGLRLDPRAPDRFSLLTGIGTSLVMLDRPEEAIAPLEEAVALRPDHPAPMFQLTQAYVRVGRTDDARAMLARYRALASLDAYLHAPLARQFPEVVEKARADLRALGVDV